MLSLGRLKYYDICSRTSYKKSVTLSESQEVFAILKAFRGSVKAFDFNSLAVSVDNLLRVHEDRERSIFLYVCELWKD